MAGNVTPNYSWANKYATTLSSGITATDTTIPLTSLPTPSEGHLVIEPDSSTAYEIIYYTSKTGSAVVCPSVAAGRGQGASTAASHSSGATVRMDSTADMFQALQDATALTGIHTNNTNYGFDFVASGCVWTGDSLGSTRAASMTAGVVYINGRRHTVAVVTARTFTASKDTYVDLLYSTVDNIATPVYTEVANNAASPALASNSVRIAIIVTGATTIAAAGSINQGQETMVLPIATSTAYTTVDSLGNLICPRDANRKILGYRQITSNITTTSATSVTATGLSVPVIVPTGRKVKVTMYCYFLQSSAVTSPSLSLYVGATLAALTTQIQTVTGPNSAPAGVVLTSYYTPTTTSLFFNGGMYNATGGNTTTVNCASTAPAFILVELI